MTAMAIGTSTRMPPGFLGLGRAAGCEPVSALFSDDIVDAADVNAIIPAKEKFSAPAGLTVTPPKLLIFS